MTFGRKEGNEWHIYKGMEAPNKFYDYQVYPKMPQNFEEGWVYKIKSEELFTVRKRGTDIYESL